MCTASLMCTTYGNCESEKRKTGLNDFRNVLTAWNPFNKKWQLAWMAIGCAMNASQ